MACGLQKLFAVEAELEDEDFLLAVEDAENQFSDSVPVNSGCLRPSSSGPRDPSNPLAPADVSQLPALSSTDVLSPVIGLQNLPKLKVGADCPSSTTPGLRPLSGVNNRIVDPPAVGFKTLKNQMTPTLAAPGLHASNRPALAEKFSVQVCRRDEYSHGQTAFKKLRVGDPMVTPSLGGSVSPQQEGSQAISTGTDRTQTPSPFQQTDPALKLKLRPSTAGSCSSQSSLVAPGSSLVNAVSQGSPAGVSCGTISAPRCHTPRPLLAAWGQSGTEASSPSVTPVKAPTLISPRSGNPRPPAPQMPSQGGSTPTGPNSRWRPPLRLPTGPRSLMTCVESPTSTAPRAPYSAAATLQTPVVTNHLVQLVTAANKTPRAAGWTPSRVKTRRFPGPAGILPHQLRSMHSAHSSGHRDGGKNLEEILISAPQTPAHGALAKLQTEEVPSSQQPIEEDFGKGPWIAMKRELRLDERDPSCFLRTYSVAMVLRKPLVLLASAADSVALVCSLVVPQAEKQQAALKQLPKNKVPSMAVMIKSLTRTNVDAGVVFKDPTGEMQGTVHRLLLEERQSDLRPGSVLLLKQVGVFSPSHRNHYLNVTPNNLAKIYLPESRDGSPLQPSQEHGETGDRTMPVSLEVQSPAEVQQDFPANAPRLETTPGDMWRSRRDGNSSWSTDPSPGRLLLLGSHGASKSGSNRPSQEEHLGAEACDMDDLDGLLGQLPEDFFSASGMESSW